MNAQTCVFLILFSGDIGGQMGLFIGASILTVLELFDYLYEVNNKKETKKNLHMVNLA